ncbi:MAG: hypothetical protein Q9173_003308 [Seirophora scorigena]
MSGRGRTLVKAISGLVGVTSVIPQVGFNVDPVVFAPVEDALIDIIALQDGDDGDGIFPLLEAAVEQGAFFLKFLFQSALQTNWWPLIFGLLLVCFGLALAHIASLNVMWSDLASGVAALRTELELVRGVRDTLRSELDTRALELTQSQRDLKLQTTSSEELNGRLEEQTRQIQQLEKDLKEAKDDEALAMTNLGLHQTLLSKQDEKVERLEAEATESTNAIVTKDEAIRQLQDEISHLKTQHRTEVIPQSEPSAAIAKPEASASGSLDLPQQSQAPDVSASSAQDSGNDTSAASTQLATRIVTQNTPDPKSLCTGANTTSGSHDMKSDQPPAVPSSSVVPSSDPKLLAQPVLAPRTSVAGWTSFTATVEGKEAAEKEQQKAERAARQAEEKRTGIQQNMSLPPMRETFRQVKMGANDERQISSTVKSITGSNTPASQPTDASPFAETSAPVTGKPTAEVYVRPSKRQTPTSPVPELEADVPETHSEGETPTRKKKQNRRKNIRRRNKREAEQAGEAASAVPADEQGE